MDTSKVKQDYRINDSEKKTYVIKESIIDKYRDQLIKACPEVIKLISNYISRNSFKLSSRGPSNRVPFLASDENKLFEICGVTREELSQCILDTKLINRSWNNFQVAPFSTLCIALLICYYQNDKNFKYKKKDDYRYYNYPSLYLTLRFYSSIYMHRFKFDPNPMIMDYTMENLSKQFLFKKVNNVYDMIKYWAETNITNMEKFIVRGADSDIIFVFNNLNTRISQNMNKIATEFYKNHAENKKSTVNILKQKDEENDMFIGDVSNISVDIEVAVRRIQTKFISDSLVDLQILEIACNNKQISKAKMSVIINKIREADDLLLRELVKMIISYYLQTTKKKINTIKSQAFTVEMLRMYKVSNTVSEALLKIRSILDELLKKYSEEYLKTSREATLSAMKACLYIYMVLYIAKNAD